MQTSRAYTISLLVLLIICGACNSSKQAEGKKLEETKAGEGLNKEADENAIVFVVMKIKRLAAEGKSIVTLISESRSLGTIKGNNLKSKNYENYLTMNVYEHGKLGSTVIIEHPLYKYVEYLDSTNTLSMRFIELEEDEFFVRLQMHTRSGEIQIFEKIKGEEERELNTIKL